MQNKLLISDQMGHKSMKIRSNECVVDGIHFAKFCTTIVQELRSACLTKTLITLSLLETFPIYQLSRSAFPYLQNCILS